MRLVKNIFYSSLLPKWIKAQNLVVAFKVNFFFYLFYNIQRKILVYRMEAVLIFCKISTTQLYRFPIFLVIFLLFGKMEKLFYIYIYIFYGISFFRNFEWIDVCLIKCIRKRLWLTIFVWRLLFWGIINL